VSHREKYGLQIFVAAKERKELKRGKLDKLNALNGLNKANSCEPIVFRATRSLIRANYRDLEFVNASERCCLGDVCGSNAHVGIVEICDDIRTEQWQLCWLSRAVRVCHQQLQLWYGRNSIFSEDAEGVR